MRKRVLTENGATNEHTRSVAVVNHGLGCLGWFVKETPAATYSLTYGVPDGHRYC